MSTEIVQFCAAGTARSAPVIQMIENQTVVVGGRLTVKCQALAKEPPAFNLVHILPNGSKVPIEIGGNINKRKGKGISVHVCSRLRLFY